MRVSELIRKIIFWVVDFMNGGNIYYHYKDIKYIAECDDDLVKKEKIKKYLYNLLTHATTTTAFYNNLDSTNIKMFPVVNKEIIRSSYQKFESKAFTNKKRIAVSTSGSTGASFMVYQDLNKKRRNTADIIYFSEITGYKIGYKLFYLRFWNMFKSRNKIHSIFQNIIPIDVFDLSSETIKNLIDYMSKNNSNKGMLGYASSFGKICDYLDTIKSDKIDCNIKSAIGISERLDSTTKVSMKKYFDIDIVSRYSNAENGMLAQQPIDQEYFEINEASYFIEILSLTNDREVAQGELGRIVITDLFNYNTPMIRYDTGDMGVIDTIIKNKKSKRVLVKVEGRKMDMIHTTDGEILSTSILLVINKYKEIKQRQIIQQTKKEYLFKLKIESNTFEKENEFIDEFRGYFGDDSIISIEYVDHIPLLASGKHRAIINNVKK